MGDRLTVYRDDIQGYDYTTLIAGVNKLGCQKLGKFEDLEEQLGYPIEIVFKLAQQGEFYYEQDGELHLIVAFDIELRNNNIYFDENWIDHDIELGDFGTIALPLKDYKKTWFLRRDKSE